MRRNVCVVGWSFRREFYASLPCHVANATVIAHRVPPFTAAPVVVSRPNVGLEWGAYAYFLARIWQGGDTLFLHDDTEATSEALADLFAARESSGYDMAFIFQSPESARLNSYHHGRAWIASEDFLGTLAIRGGIWYDQENT